MAKLSYAVCSVLGSLLIISILLPTAGCISLAARQQEIDAYEASGKCFACQGSSEVDCPECHGRGEVSCPDCSGSGKKSGVPLTDTDLMNSCSNCGGSGEIRCPKCNGFLRVSCDRCRGTGIVPKKVTPAKPLPQ